MLATPLKTFIHPAQVYRLEYPAHWDQLIKEEGKSCGFGPHERDDVGLWISILPMSIDTDRLAKDLPNLMKQALPMSEAGNLRKDDTLRHFTLKADVLKEREAGHYWIVVGGDVVLFASTQVPAAERDDWNPAFEKLMASLQITRDDQLLHRKIACDVLELLRKKHPEQEFELDEKGIRGKKQMVFLSNLYREVRAAPTRREAIVREFVDNLERSAELPMGEEVYEEIRGHILPVLKPRDYIQPDGPTRHLLITDWVGDIIIVYAICNKKLFRFVTGWDVDRWGTTSQELHDLALTNLTQLSWPRRLEGARMEQGGRVILIETGDGLASSRLLHPDLHRLLSGPLGSPFWAGIPDRDTLVTFSDRRPLKQRIGRKLKKDHDSSAYPICPDPFLVTRDGIVAGVKR